ncbi:hypothetical protein [Mucilaginibacter sp.]
MAISNATFEEFIKVLVRKKFDKYFVDDEERWAFIDRAEINFKCLLIS